MQENILLQISDSTIAFAYFVLPAILLFHNNRFNALGGKNLLALGITLIFSCGLGYVMHALNTPTAVMITQNTITASISVIAAIAIYKILPQLLTNTELLKEIQKNSQDGVVTLQAIRADGKIFDLKWIDVNPAATQILGRTDLLGKLHNEEYAESNDSYNLLEHYIEVL